VIRNILVPVDGSTFGEHALPLACSLARKAGATLHLVHVHQIVPPATLAGVAVMDSVDLHLRQDEQAYLADLARRVGECGPMPVKTALVDGVVAEALANYAHKVVADLAVMSTHGRGAMGRFWLGSVADDLVRDLPRPVLLVRPHEGKPDLRRQMNFETILLPLDGSQHAEKILDPAVNLGKLFNSHLLLMRVVKPVLRPTYLPEGTSILGLTHSVLEEIHILQQQHMNEAQHYLDGVAAPVRQTGLKVTTKVVIDEEPAIGILLEAQVRQVDLIAMETHARRGLSRLLAGSTADKLVRGANMPVLLNRPVE